MNNGNITGFTMGDDMSQESGKSLAGLMESHVTVAASSCGASRFKELAAIGLTGRLSRLQSDVPRGQVIPTYKQKYNFIPPLEACKYQFADSEKEKRVWGPEDVGYADAASFHLAH
ncbi:hypothetical protein Tco_1052718 [Tanacetum coccineum]